MAEPVLPRIERLLLDKKTSEFPIPGVLRPWRSGAHKDTYLRQIKLKDGTLRLTVIKRPKDAPVDIPVQLPDAPDVNIVKPGWTHKDLSTHLGLHALELDVKRKLDEVFEPVKLHAFWFDPALGRVEEWEYAGIDLDLASATRDRFNSKLFRNSLRDAFQKAVQVYKRHRIGVDTKLANFTLVPTSMVTLDHLKPGEVRRRDISLVGSGERGIAYVDHEPQYMMLPDAADPWKFKPFVLGRTLATLLQQVHVKDSELNRDTRYFNTVKAEAFRETESQFAVGPAGEVKAWTERYLKDLLSKKKPLDLILYKEGR
jgi:hypothetical protein